MDDDATATHPPPGADPPPAPPQRRLERSRTDRWLTGVCGGLGAYFGVDPLIFRIGFIVLTVAGGAGLWLYLGAWLLIPEEGHRRSIVHHLVGHRSLGTIAAIVLIAIGVGNLTSEFDFFHGGRIVWGLLLIGGGIYLFRSTSGQRSTAGDPGAPPDSPPPSPAEPPPPPAQPQPAEPPASYGHGRGWGPRPVEEPGVGAPGGWPEGPRDRARSVTPYVLSLLLVGGGTAAFLDAADVIDLSPVPVLAASVLVTGGGLLLTAWWGRGRGLIPLGIVLALALGVAATADSLGVPLRGGIGDRPVRPASIGDLKPEYRLRMGTMTIDLTGVPFSGTDPKVTASVGMGELVVLVPDGVGVEVDASVGIGAIELFGREDGGGVGVERTRVVPSATPISGRVRLDLRTGIGRVEVRRAISLLTPMTPGFVPPSPLRPPVEPDGGLEVPDAAA